MAILLFTLLNTALLLHLHTKLPRRDLVDEAMKRDGIGMDN